MKIFAALCRRLDEASSPAARAAALDSFFHSATDADRLWAAALLAGHRPRRSASPAELRLWAGVAARLPDWLVGESHALCGDLAETIALILPPPPDGEPPPGLAETLDALSRLPGQPAASRRQAIETAWDHLSGDARVLFTALAAGSFRSPVSQAELAQTLARATGRDEAALAHRLAGDWDPARTTFAALLDAATAEARPYPFAVVAPLQVGPEALGPAADWRADWHGAGIRCQMIARPGVFALWSQEAGPITRRFPEFAALADFLPPGTVLEGEIVAWDDAAGRVLPPAKLPDRITRKTMPARRQQTPIRFLAQDLLQADGHDLRALPLSLRRARLDRLLTALPDGLPLMAAALIAFDDWSTLSALRNPDHNAGALVLKRRDSPYRDGPASGDWQEWKPEPFTVDAVLIYAQIHALTGQGRQAGQGSEFTFALRDGAALVPFARLSVGLGDAESAELSHWVQAHTVERFGPVRRVPAELVFEIAFDGIAPSPRHKSGIALRSARISRWRRGMSPAGIDTIERLRGLLAVDRGLRAPGPPRDI